MIICHINIRKKEESILQTNHLNILNCMVLPKLHNIGYNILPCLYWHLYLKSSVKLRKL